jgi:hypothetical protein
MTKARVSPCKPKKPSDQYLGLICDESLTCRGLNSNLGHFGSFTLILVHVENCVCLSRGVQVAGVAWRAATRIMAGVEDLVQRTGDGQAQAGTRWPSDRKVG